MLFSRASAINAATVLPAESGERHGAAGIFEPAPVAVGGDGDPADGGDVYSGAGLTGPYSAEGNEPADRAVPRRGRALVPDRGEV